MAPTVDSLSHGNDAVLLIHGGAGDLDRERMSEGRERKCIEKLEESLRAGWEVVSKGGSSLDAATRAVRVLEDSTLYNAGRGSVLTSKGTVEMDAAVMEGATRRAGAVASINCVANPIMAARAIMEISPHVLMVGAGANRFLRKVASAAGLKIVKPEYFITSENQRRLVKFLEEEKKALSSGKRLIGLSTGASQAENCLSEPTEKFGTVGAVALDATGNLAAATSTGGMTGKLPGRVGDSPIVGAGVYADNSSCAVSCTGHGEYFIRGVIPHEISALMRLKGLSLNGAAEEVFEKFLNPMGGQGGLIALSADGNWSMPFNTTGMFRGVARKDGTIECRIF